MTPDGMFLPSFAVSLGPIIMSRLDRAAFTLTEVLIVLAIIAIVIALMLPAVQRVRESAARGQCANNLKQIALAVFQYEGAYKRLPPAGRGYSWCQTTAMYPADPQIVNFNGMTLLLPFLEQESLVAQFRMNESFCNMRAPVNATFWPDGFYTTNPMIGDATTNGNAAMVSLPFAVFRCPSDSGDPVIPSGTWYSPGGNFTAAKTNYDFISRYWEFYQCNSWRTDGSLRYMFGQNSNCPVSQVTDGMSNTFMLTETTLDIYNGCGVAWGYRGFAMTGLDPAHPWPARGINDWDAITPDPAYTPIVGRLTSWAYAVPYLALVAVLGECC
jgi:prepilin-type N-terminal cleavage/methylation domain-containing protein